MSGGVVECELFDVSIVVSRMAKYYQVYFN